MTERDIEANFLIIKDAFQTTVAQEEELKVLVSSLADVLCQFFVDIHRIADAAELALLDKRIESLKK